jgi:hypothetical protein
MKVKKDKTNKNLKEKKKKNINEKGKRKRERKRIKKTSYTKWVGPYTLLAFGVEVLLDLHPAWRIS